MIRPLISAVIRSVSVGLGLVMLFAQPNTAFWLGDRKSSQSQRSSELLQPSARLPSVYAVALNELEALESEPLCHRIAARLLVRNCQILDGKDDATVLTDSGRQLRDFVDSYAASLAICDLQRGKFSIPSACAKFQESALSRLSVSDQLSLHVSSQEIDLCLSALGTSDSAWNTWVSYRHKALRFCEAARVDNERMQNIVLYKRLTEVMAKLMNSVETEIQERIVDFDSHARQVAESMGQLSPLIDGLKKRLTKVERYLAEDIDWTLNRSSQIANGSLGQAEILQQLLEDMVRSAFESRVQMTTVHERSLELAKGRAKEELGDLLPTIASAVASSTILQNQIEISRLQAAELAARQESIEDGLSRLTFASETLFSKYGQHSRLLQQAGNITECILDALEEAATVASNVNRSLFSASASSGWWPHILCPTVSLVMGSYGLPPSAFRNLALVALGEAVGFVISSHAQFGTRLLYFGNLAATTNKTSAGLRSHRENLITCG